MQLLTLFKYIRYLVVLLFFLVACFESKSAYALEASSKSKHVSNPATLKKSMDSCTKRCHVNYMAYENDYKLPKGVKNFRHKTHSTKQDLDCSDCHKDIEVNTKGHGKLTTEQNDCLKCHHITPDLDCAKCHENDINRSFYTDPQKGKTLSWTISFDHSQHPEQDLSCKECHLISRENDVGIVGYNLNCSKCHHVTEEVMDCAECHKEPSAYLRGEIDVEGIDPVPDMMSRAVKCEGCHKYDEEGLKFTGIKEHCVKCHNNNYGKLYDAWGNTIRSEVRKINYRLLSLYEESRFSYTDVIEEANVNGKEDEKITPQSASDAFLEKTSKLADLITKYGMHNFSLTKSLLDHLKDNT
ncbi:MAG: hypothetical protein JYX80_02000 [Candidatus Scalindua sediminis]|nr:hypothetical protein [Candidatus Scalindua sediminis]